MPTVDDMLGAPTPMGADLAAGLDTISYDQTIVFDPYVRLVLPFDGYVFWVKASSLNPSAVLNAMELGTAQLNAMPTATAPAQFSVKGSLHYSTELQQAEATNFSRNRVVFSSQAPVRDLNQQNDNLIYICTFDSAAGNPVGSTPIKFAFSARAPYYQQANEWHYIGHSVTSPMFTQIVDNMAGFSVSEPIVSNSLPLWLAWNNYDPVYPVPVPRPPLQFYPSFLLPTNLTPPYVSVHVDPERTESLQEMPILTSLSNQQSLTKDTVRLILYGCNDAVAQSLLYALMQYTRDTGLFGITNMPVVQDEKEGQVEFMTLAQKKRITFEVSYNQGTLRNVSRQLILSCTPTMIPNPTGRILESEPIINPVGA